MLLPLQTWRMMPYETPGLRTSQRVLLGSQRIFCGILLLRDNALISWQIVSLNTKYYKLILGPPKSVRYSKYSRHFLCVVYRPQTLNLYDLFMGNVRQQQKMWWQAPSRLKSCLKNMVPGMIHWCLVWVFFCVMLQTQVFTGKIQM